MAAAKLEAGLALSGDAAGAKAAVGEAREIAQRLGCHPLIDRADQIASAALAGPAGLPG